MSKQLSERTVRIGAGLAVAAGMGAFALSILAPELRLGTDIARETFGWKRASLLAVGLVAVGFGALALARPRIVSSRVAGWEGLGREERAVRTVGALIVVGGVATCGLAFFADELGMGTGATRGLLGWRRISVLLAGAVPAAIGVLIFARPRAISRWIARVSLNTELGEVTIRRSLWGITYVSADGVEIELDIPSPRSAHRNGRKGALRVRSSFAAESAGSIARATEFAGQTVALVDEANVELAERARRARETERARTRDLSARDLVRIPAFTLAAVGVPAALAGVIVIAPCSPAAACSTGRELGGSLLTIVGAQLVMLGLFCQAYASYLSRREGRQLDFTGAWAQAVQRKGIAIGLPALVVGLAATVALTDRWLIDGIGELSETRVIGVLALAMATQLVISSALILGGGALVALLRRLRETGGSSTGLWALSWLRTPAGIATALAVCFLAIGWWWVTTDTRPPTNDAVRHLGHAHSHSGLLRAGEVTEALTTWTPFAETPLVHIVGGIAMLLSGGMGNLWPTFTANLIFVPLLALGAYGTATIAWGDRRAGVLAVMFVLAAPMVMSMFRVFMIDAPLAAMTALATWLVLASERFARRGYTIAAGIAIGGGVMTKVIFPFYVVGLVALVLVRGGWRNWRNLAWVAIPVALIAIPWMAVNWAELSSRISDHLTATGGWAHGDQRFPPRWSVEGFTYYGWDIVNNALFLPLTLFFLIGIAVAMRDAVRGWWDRANYAPELLAGLVGGYLLVSMLPLNDSRYILPLILYASVLGTGWILRLGRQPRTAVVAVLAAILVANTAVQNLAIGERVILMPETWEGEARPPNKEGQLTVLSPQGFIFGSPDDQARTGEILERAKELGVRRASKLPGTTGLFVLLEFNLRAAGLPEVRDPQRLGPDEIAIRQWSMHGLNPAGAPCTRWENGYEYYVYRGDRRRLPAEAYDPWCPLTDDPR